MKEAVDDALEELAAIQVQNTLTLSGQALTRIAQKTINSLAPPPDVNVSDWADKYRRLSPEASAEAGAWSTDRAEYQRGIMDAISDDKIENIVVMSCAQIGKTEMLLNLIGYHIDQEPAPMLVVQPTLDMAATFSRDRLAPMLREHEMSIRQSKRPARERQWEHAIHQTV